MPENTTTFETSEHEDSDSEHSDEEAEPEDFSSDRHFPKTYQIKDEEAVSLQKIYVLHLSSRFENNKIKLAAGLSDYQCVLYDVENGFRKNITQKVHDDEITGVKFVDKDDNLFYTSSLDGTVKLWDVREMEKPSLIFKDDTDGTNELKPVNCFGISCDGKFIGAGTVLVDADAYVLFWDARQTKVLGGYWETHTDDVTAIEFNPVKSNIMLSGSTDGLINLFDVSALSEDDALQNTFNVESCIRRLKWVNIDDDDRIGCVTDMETLQFWNTEDTSPYANFSRKLIASSMYVRSADNAYVTDIHQSSYDKDSDIIVLGGSNVQKGEYLKSLVLNDQQLQPSASFAENKQIVRCSSYDDDVFITAGESGIISVWEATNQPTDQMQLKDRTKKFKQKHTEY